MRTTLVMIGLTVGSIIGGFVPMLWGAGFLSYSSLVANAVGGILGVIVTVKLTQDF